MVMVINYAVMRISAKKQWLDKKYKIKNLFLIANLYDIVLDHLLFLVFLQSAVAIISPIIFIFFLISSYGILSVISILEYFMESRTYFVNTSMSRLKSLSVDKG